MATMETRGQDAAALARAKDYPYATPPHSYVFAGGVALTLTDTGGDPLRCGQVTFDGQTMTTSEALRRLGLAADNGMEARIPVLAYGSNGAPEQLARKFVNHDDRVVVVVRAHLADFDVVYAPHFTRYGTIPATLAPSAGTSVSVSIIYLSPAQRDHMHDTEISAGNYVFGRLTGVALAPRGLADLSEPLAYVSPYGSLDVAGAPVALAAVSADGRRYQPRQTTDVLNHARDLLNPGVELDHFIGETIADHALRQNRTRALRRSAIPFAIDGFMPETPFR